MLGIGNDMGIGQQQPFVRINDHAGSGGLKRHLRLRQRTEVFEEPAKEWVSQQGRAVRLAGSDDGNADNRRQDPFHHRGKRRGGGKAGLGRNGTGLRCRHHQQKT